MHVGIFLEERRRGASAAETFQETLALAEAAERSGLDAVWLGEIHFNGGRSLQPAPLALAAFIAARTRRIRIGTAVQVLPLAHPLRIAEEVATVDQLSEGRVEFGVGRSGSPTAYDVLGVPYAESQARFLEALAVIREAWRGEPFTHAGTFYRFENVTVTPPPRQRPHPPIRMAANSAETFEQVARLGLPLLVGLRDLDLAGAGVCIDAYRRAWRAAGHAGRPEVHLRIPVYAAPTEAEARDEPRENITYFLRRHVELLRAGLGRTDTGPARRRRELADEIAGMTYDDVLKSRVAFGSAAGLRERLGTLRDDLGLDGVIAEPNPGGLLSLERQLRTLVVLARDVAPVL